MPYYDEFGRKIPRRQCEHCGGERRKFGRYCSKCYRLLKSQGRSTRNRFDFGPSYDPIGILFMLGVLIGAVWLILYLLYSTTMKIWNSGIFGKVLLLSPFIIAGLYLVYKIWNAIKPVENERHYRNRILIFILAYIGIAGIILIFFWGSGVHKQNLQDNELKIQIEKELSKTFEQKLLELNERLPYCNQTFINAVYSKGAYRIVIQNYTILNNYSIAVNWINLNSTGNKPDLINKIHNTTFPIAIFEGSAVSTQSGTFRNYNYLTTTSLICTRENSSISTNQLNLN